MCINDIVVCYVKKRNCPSLIFLLFIGWKFSYLLESHLVLVSSIKYLIGTLMFGKPSIL